MKTLRLVLLATAGFALAGCGKKDPHAGHDHAGHTHHHEHKAPHGGTAVVLGNETYHLEFVLDATTGKLSAYVLDGEMEKFVRSAMPSFEVVATIGGAKQPLMFQAVADTATGETVGDTSLFVAQADWLKTTKEFDAVVTKFEVRGSSFSGIAFNFPKGNEKH
jgi:predicted small lipoprotein YifL